MARKEKRLVRITKKRERGEEGQRRECRDVSADLPYMGMKGNYYYL